MSVYNVQKFTYNNGDSSCYGQQDVHNHDRATKFTKDVKAYLENQGCINVVPGTFLSEQPKPSSGKEFSWNDKDNKWVRD